MLTHYFGKPQQLEETLWVYPVSVMEWETFRPVAERFLLISYDLIQKRFKCDPSVKLFDFILQGILTLPDETERVKQFQAFEQLLSIPLQQPMKGFYHRKKQQWFFFNEDQTLCLHAANYDAWRDVVMKQNLIFEPLIVEDERAQADIDKAFARLNGDEPTSLESIIAYVSCVKGIPPEQFSTYTYYQLRVDYEMAQRISAVNASHLYLSQGGKGEIPSVSAPLSLHESPYSLDRIFKKVDRDRDGQLQQLMT